MWQRTERHLRPDHHEVGAAATEYALVVSGIALVVVFGAQVFGSFLDERWSSMLTWLTS